MSDDRMEGALKQGVGKVQDAVGGLTGDTGTQAKGKANQAAGSAQDMVGQAKDKAQDALGDIQRYAKEQPLATLGITFAAGAVFGFLLRGNQK